MGTASDALDRSSGAQRYVCNIAVELGAPKTGATSAITVSTISSEEQRSDVPTHSFAAPKIAPLTVDAINSGDTLLGSPCRFAPSRIILLTTAITADSR
jgi:hypothetical protein